MDLHLSNKVAMVGGASKGLGLAVARALRAEGALVSIASRDPLAIGNAQRELEKEFGHGVFGMGADLRSADDILAWHQATLDVFKRVDLLFVNTGGPPPGASLAFDDQAWTDAFELLVLSALRLARAVVPSMRSRGGGAILMSTSSSVKEPIPNLALSTVLRASVSSLAKTLAVELAPDRIRVNQLIPGRIATDRLRELDTANAGKAHVPVDTYRAQSAAAIPLGRYGEADEFGRAAAFLLSDAASYITGATLQVDGGLIKSCP